MSVSRFSASITILQHFTRRESCETCCVEARTPDRDHPATLTCAPAGVSWVWVTWSHVLGESLPRWLSWAQCSSSGHRDTWPLLQWAQHAGTPWYICCWCTDTHGDAWCLVILWSSGNRIGEGWDMVGLTFYLICIYKRNKHCSVRSVSSSFVSSVTLYFKNPWWRGEKGWGFYVGQQRVGNKQGRAKNILTTKIFVKNFHQEYFCQKYSWTEYFWWKICPRWHFYK